MKKTFGVIVLLGIAAAVRAATWESFGDWAFTNLVSENVYDTTVGWYFSSEGGLSGQQINGVSFSGVTVGETEGSGSSGILSWGGAAGYSLAGYFYWGASYPVQNAMSVGGLWSQSDLRMSLDLDIAAGTDYIIELVSLQPSGSSSSRTFDLYVDGALTINDYYVPATDPFNVCVKVYGTSDGNVDLDFTAGSYGDPAPAFSIITVTQIPEPASIAMLGVVLGAGFFIRRRFLV
ncbi:MAG: PEP-CTERM sorting domain-containing protein [Kiritimatiellales bacterium]